MTEDFVNKCLELYENNPELKPVRDREFLEKRADIRKYYITLRKKLDRYRSEVASIADQSDVRSVRSEPVVRFRTQQAVIPDMSQQVQASYEEVKGAMPPPEAEFQSSQNDVQQWIDNQPDRHTMSNDLSARRIRLQLLLSRDDLNEDAMKILEKTKKLNIAHMDEHELEVMEELAGMALSKHYAKSTGQKLLHSVSSIIERTAQRPEGTVSKVVDNDKLLQEDFATVLGRYAIGTSTILRSVILFSFDVGSALLKSRNQNNSEEE